MKQLLSIAIGGILLFSGCVTDDPPPVDLPEKYTVVFENEFNLLQAQFAAYLSDENGEVKAFAWLNGSDSTHLQYPEGKEKDFYDCTVAKMTILSTASGADTTVELITYNKVRHNSVIHLRKNDFRQVTMLQVQLTNIASLDTIIVPEGLTFIKPTSNTNYFGQYRVVHTGDIWFKFKANGDPHWRYMVFANVGGPSLSATIDITLLPLVFDEPPVMKLPFLTTWKYTIQGVKDLNSRRFLALGDLERAPGGALPVIDKLEILEPIQSGFSGYRVQVQGTLDQGNEGYTYFCDKFYDQLPLALNTPDFDMIPTVLGDNRLVAVNCSGSCDVMSVIRRNTGHPHVYWQALAPSVSGLFVHRLPDVPKALGSLFPDLKTYNFGGYANVRAENYDFLDGYEPIQRKLMENDDPLWMAKAGYLAREEKF